MPNWKKIIVSGSDASLSSLHIDGNLTASAAYLTSASIGHLETIYETASVIYSSGSTKFGDTSDDTHEITGSLLVSGNAQFVDILGVANEIVMVGSNNSLTSSTILSLDPANNYIGINQPNPEVTLHMSGDGAQTAQIRMEQYNDSSDAPDIRTRKARGTSASPAKNNAGDFIYRQNSERYNGSAYTTVGQFAVDSTGSADRFRLTLAVSEDGNTIDAADAQFMIDGNNGGAIKFNDSYYFPTSDGTNGQALITNGSGVLSFGNASTASYALTAVTASHALTAVTASHTAGTASIANNAVTASNINHLTQDVSITGSTDISGSVTAHSFNISSNAVGTPSIYSDSNINLSASNAVVITSSPLRLASFTNAQTGSITGQVGDIIYNSDTATYDLYSGSWLTILNETSTASIANFATTASHALNVPATSSHALTAVTASHTAGTASISNKSTTSSFASTGDGIFSGSFSGSFDGDGSNLTGITVAETTLASASFTSVSSYTASHALNSTELTVTVYNSNNEQILPSTVRILDSSNVGLDFGGATISGKVVLAKGGHIVSGSISVVEETTVTSSFTSQTSITSSHNFDSKNINVIVYDSNDNQIIPSNVRTLDDDNVGIDFALSTTGRAVITKGGHLVSGTPISASFAESSSVTDLATTAITTTGTASVANTATTASYTAGTASIADTATTASHVVTASFADTSTTSSYGFNMTASSIRVEGTASIVYLESVYETASVIYSSGSTKFGDDTSDVHERTGSIDISGSLTVEGNANLVTSQSINNRDSSGLSFWAGSQAQYDALGSYDSNTIYYVT